MKILITSPSLNINENVSGISSHTRLLLKYKKYLKHFQIGRTDDQKRNLQWIWNQVKNLIDFNKQIKDCDGIHFNLPLEVFSIISSVAYIIIARINKIPLLVHIRGGKYSGDAEIPYFMLKLLAFSLSLDDNA